MERLTHYETPEKHAYVDRGLVSLGWYSMTDEGFRGPAIDRLAAYEDAMPLERAQELAQADQDGRLVVLPEAPKEGDPVPDCFYNYDGGDLCMGLAKSVHDDEPTEKCKRCWYCESTRQEAEAAVEGKEVSNDA